LRFESSRGIQRAIPRFWLAGGARSGFLASMIDLEAHPRLLILLRIAFWGALVFAIFMALDPKPPQIGPANLWDKWYHMAAFATLAFLGGLGWPRLPLLRLGEHLSFVGALIEVLQANPLIHRDCDIFDWVADTIAIAVVLLFIGFVRKRASRGS
jgi:hypothetical protein